LKTWLPALAALGLGVGLLAPPARGQATVPFDSNSTANPPNTVGTDVFPNTTGLDYAVGNGLARPDSGNLGAGITVGQTFTFYYQAVVTALNITGGQTVPPNLDVTADGVRPGGAYELTAVATFRETVAALIPLGGGQIQAIFTLIPDPANLFSVFYDDAGAPADNVTGTGFGNGTLVFSANPSTLGYVSNFTNTGSIAPDVDPVGPNYPGVNSVIGSGTTNFNATLVSVNNAFFPGGLGSVIGVNFTTNVGAPFTNTAASALIGGLTPAIGTTNGTSGPDIIFAVDANSSFLGPTGTPVPEPGTISLALTGVGLTSLVALRRRRPVGTATA